MQILEPKSLKSALLVFPDQIIS